MNRISVLVLFSLISFFSVSQEEAKVYDQVYLNGGRVLTGEIIIFQETDGDITFKDLEGRTYSITRKEYRYFRERVVFINRGDTTIIKQRKQDTYGGSVGIYTGMNLNDFSVSFYGTYGKYFSWKNYVGASIEYSLVSFELNTYVNPKIFIKHQYDAYRKNISSYIVGELGYAYAKGKLPIELYSGNTANVFNVEQKANFVSVGLGHGFGFYLKNTNSISLEVVFTRNEALNVEVLRVPDDVGSGYNINPDKPNRSYNSIGLRVAINL